MRDTGMGDDEHFKDNLEELRVGEISCFNAIVFLKKTPPRRGYN